MCNWQILDTGLAPAHVNMGLDADLLENLKDNDDPILHFYEWEQESATYGYFVDPSKYLDLKKASILKLDLAKRPTGGGIVFHIWDFAFSVLVPMNHPSFSSNTLDNYAFINRAVLESVKEFLGLRQELVLTPVDGVEFDGNCGRFCMARPTKYDVMLKDKKIAGAAQRKQKNGYLHQGSIALVMPNLELLNEVLLPGTKVLEAMLAHTIPLLGITATTQEMKRAKEELKLLLHKKLKES